MIKKTTVMALIASLLVVSGCAYTEYREPPKQQYNMVRHYDSNGKFVGSTVYYTPVRKTTNE